MGAGSPAPSKIYSASALPPVIDGSYPVDPETAAAVEAAVIKSGASPTKKPSIGSFDISSVKVKRHYLTTSTAAMKRY